MSRCAPAFHTGCLPGCALGAGAYWSVRLAWADYLFRLDTESSVGQAVALAPGSAEYHARWATLLEESGREDAATSELNEAVRADPLLAGAWIELGLRAENTGDAARAETYLARAGRADRMYATQWTLANFYFRHDQRDKFWPAAQRALRVGDVAAYDPAPLFRLCWKLTRDPATILERAIPNAGPVQARYLEFLVRENLTRAAKPVTERVVALGSEGDLGAVYEYCDRMIAAGDARDALDAWNALCWRTLRGYRALAPEAGASLTNGEFANAPVEHGFDWRMPPAEGVTVERGGMPPRLWITLDGRAAGSLRSPPASASPWRLHASTGCGSAIRPMELGRHPGCGGVSRMWRDARRSRLTPGISRASRKRTARCASRFPPMFVSRAWRWYTGARPARRGLRAGYRCLPSHWSLTDEPPGSRTCSPRCCSRAFSPAGRRDTGRWLWSRQARSILCGVGHH